MTSYEICNGSDQVCPESILDSGQFIIDAHHHLYDRPGNRYLSDDLLKDTLRGHGVRATVFVQARFAYRTTGPEYLRSVGETEYAVATAHHCQTANSNFPRICEAIVGHADLCIGESVSSSLEAHIHAGSGKFKGIRMPLTWDQDDSLLNPAYPTSSTLIEDARFLDGFARLAQYRLSRPRFIHNSLILLD